MPKLITKIKPSYPSATPETSNCQHVWFNYFLMRNQSNMKPLIYLVGHWAATSKVAEGSIWRWRKEEKWQVGRSSNPNQSGGRYRRREISRTETENNSYLLRLNHIHLLFGQELNYNHLSNFIKSITNNNE